MQLFSSKSLSQRNHFAPALNKAIFYNAWAVLGYYYSLLCTKIPN